MRTASPRTRWVIGNWKMNGSLLANAGLLAAITAHNVRTGRVGVCVPTPYLAQSEPMLRGSTIALGAQDVSEHSNGAFTGQISAAMLRELSATLVLIGHSERRQYNGETSEQVAAKAKAALNEGLTPVICVGETLLEREQGAAEATVAAQLAPCAAVVHEAGTKLIFAYEPVWAIGTGKVASPQEAQTMHAFIRRQITGFSAAAKDTSVLYGGSVKPANARELFAQPDIDGGLIGGASLVALDFLAIVDAM